MLSAIKKIAAIVLCLLLTLSLAACGGGGGKSPEEKGNPNSNSFDPTDPSIYTIDILTEMQVGGNLGLLKRCDNAEINAAADELLKKIEEFPDTLEPTDGGRKIYVSNDGDDNNDGLSPETSVATVAKAQRISKAGDVVLFKRGDFWRGQTILEKDNVSYGAYGEGNKPTFYASIDGTQLDWVQDEDNENLWRVDVGTSSDIGLIVFNHGKAFGNKKLDKAKVIQDYGFYFDKRATELVLYMSEGNPKDLFYSIEICPDVTMVNLGHNSTAQNLRLMYTGGFGVGYVNKNHVVMQGLVIGYIGGSIMTGSTRYGNGVQLWGFCDGMTIDYCHVYQCYDAGITPQWSGDKEETGSEKNIKFTNNLLEYSVYNIEYFLRDTQGKFENVEFSGNIVRYGGYGWGTLSRGAVQEPTNIRGVITVDVENFVIKNNIFMYGTPNLLRIEVDRPDQMPVFSGNTYVVEAKTNILAEKNAKHTTAEDAKTKTAAEIFGDETGKIIVY